jgi:tetratricopeptide (TPR) repeat protein
VPASMNASTHFTLVHTPPLCSYDDVEADCRKAIELDPTATKAYIRCAKAVLAKGDIPQALELLQQAHLRDPRDSSVTTERTAVAGIQRRYGLVQGYMMSKDYERALGLLNSLAESMSASLDLHLLRAEVLLNLKKLDEAYNITTELMTGRKTVSAAAGAASAISATSAFNAGETDSRIYILRARILNMQGNTGSAIKHLQEALRVNPDDAAAGRLLKAIRRQETLKSAGNDHFKAGSWQVCMIAVVVIMQRMGRDFTVILCAGCY